MTATVEQKKPAIDDINWLCELSDNFKHYFIDKARYYRIDRGFDFYTIGAQSASLNYVVSGTVNTNLFNNEYISKTLLLTHGDWFGFNVLFEEKMAGQVKVNYIEQCYMLRWNKEVVDAISKEQPEFYKLMFFAQKKRFYDFAQNLVINNGFSAEIRVIYTLIDYGSRVKRISGSFPMVKATQQQIAEIAGVSRQQVNQVFQPLVDDDVLEISRGKIHIVNPAKLQSKLESVDLPLFSPTLLE